MSDYPMLISNKLHSFRNFIFTKSRKVSFTRNDGWHFLLFLSEINDYMPVFGLAGRTEIGSSFFCFIEYKIRIIASFYKDIV